MFTYYCKKCGAFCDFDEEIELREDQFEGDWQEFHIVCDSRVITTVNKNI